MPRNDEDDYDRPRRRDHDEFDGPRRRGDGDFDGPRGRRDRDDHYDRPPPRKKSGLKLLFILLGVGFVLVLGCGGLAVYGLFTMRETADRMKSSNNLKQMALAIHNYNDVYGTIPPNT